MLPILDNTQSICTDTDGVRTFTKAHLRAVLLKPSDRPDGRMGAGAASARAAVAYIKAQCAGRAAESDDVARRLGMAAAELVEREAPGLAFDFTSLWGHDVAGRAAAFAKMVQGGMDLECAVALSGLAVGDVA